MLEHLGVTRFEPTRQTQVAQGGADLALAVLLAGEFERARQIGGETANSPIWASEPKAIRTKSTNFGSAGSPIRSMQDMARVNVRYSESTAEARRAFNAASQRYSRAFSSSCTPSA